MVGAGKAQQAARLYRQHKNLLDSGLTKEERAQRDAWIEKHDPLPGGGMRESEEEFLAAIEAAGIALPDGPMSEPDIRRATDFFQCPECTARAGSPCKNHPCHPGRWKKLSQMDRKRVARE